MLRSKNNSCWGVDWEAIVGMICTQCKRQLRVCPRVISTHLEPGTTIGTAAMACRTVSAVGPSESLQVFGGDGRVVGGFQAQPEAPSPTISANSANSANSARIGTAER